MLFSVDIQYNSEDAYVGFHLVTLDLRITQLALTERLRFKGLMLQTEYNNCTYISAIDIVTIESLIIYKILCVHV